MSDSSGSEDERSISTPTPHSHITPAHVYSFSPSHAQATHLDPTDTSAPSTPNTAHIPSSAKHHTGYGPIKRSKDKLKHSESENRRRTRLRQKFSALREASECPKKDRYNILTCAINKLNEDRNRIIQLEHEKQAALLHGPTSIPSLATPLSTFPMLEHLPCCYISLDGRILDANYAFFTLFSYTKADIYKSSIFAITWHAELVHTLSILRHLLCGLSPTYATTHQMIDMKGQRLECWMCITAVINQGKIVMFLCMFTPINAGNRLMGTSEVKKEVSSHHVTPPITPNAPPADVPITHANQHHMPPTAHVRSEKVEPIDTQHGGSSMLIPTQLARDSSSGRISHSAHPLQQFSFLVSPPGSSGMDHRMTYPMPTLTPMANGMDSKGGGRMNEEMTSQGHTNVPSGSHSHMYATAPPLSALPTPNPLQLASPIDGLHAPMGNGTVLVSSPLDSNINPHMY